MLRAQRLRRGLLFGNVALLVVAVLAIAVLMAMSRAEARRAEAAALEARNATASANSKLAEANNLFTQALEAQKQGRSAQAAEFQRQAQQAEQQASAKPVFTPGELTELDRLRKQEAAWQRTEADLRKQLASQKDRAQGTSPTVQKAEMTGADIADLERLRKAESSWVRDEAQLQQQVTAATERATKAQQVEAALRKTNEDLQARLADSPASSSPEVDSQAAIKQLLSDYQAAYEKLDASAVTRLWPAAPSAELARSFSQYPVVHNGNCRPAHFDHGQHGRRGLHSKNVGGAEGQQAPQPTSGVDSIPAETIRRRVDDRVNRRSTVTRRTGALRNDGQNVDQSEKFFLEREIDQKRSQRSHDSCTITTPPITHCGSGSARARQRFEWTRMSY